MFINFTKISTIALALLFFGFYNYSSASFKISRPSALNVGLVGHWTFDGADVNFVTNTASDRSGQGNNGTLLNMSTSTAPAPGKLGQAFKFDGADDYVNMGNVLNMGTGDFTLSAWIKTKNTSFENIIKKRGSGAGYAISVNVNGTVYAKINDGTNNVDLTSVGTVNDNQWRHVAGVFDRDGTVTIYIDGQADNSASISSVGNTNNTNNLTLSANSSFFNGVMDDVRIYNRTLSGSEVARLYNQSLSKFNKTPTGILRNGLVGHWTFDGADVNFVTNTASDRSGQGNNGTLLNMSTSTAPAPGKLGQAFKFDGADDYVNMGDVLDAGSGSMSVSVWIKLRKLSNLSQQIIIKRHSVSPWLSWELYVSSGDEVVFQIANTSADYFNVGTTPIVKDNWYHIVGVKNGNNLTVYLNGEINQSWNTGPVAGTVQNGNRELGIGSDWVDGTYDFNGIIDDVRVYDRALSQGEVSLLYNAAR